jgi:hypothetical protein
VTEVTHAQGTERFLFSLGFEQQEERTFVRLNKKHNGNVTVERIVLDDEGNAIEGRLPIYRRFNRTWAQGKERYREPSLWEKLDLHGEMPYPDQDA